MKNKLNQKNARTSPTSTEVIIATAIGKLLNEKFKTFPINHEETKNNLTIVKQEDKWKVTRGSIILTLSRGESTKEILLIHAGDKKKNIVSEEARVGYLAKIKKNLSAKTHKKKEHTLEKRKTKKPEGGSQKKENLNTVKKKRNFVT